MRFLSPEWADAVKQALNADEVFLAGIAGKSATIQQIVTTADGEVRYWIRIDDGAVDMGLGDAASPTATITQGYDVAAGMARREVSPVTAFMTGGLKVEGNLGLLLALQEPFSRLPEVMAALGVEY